MAFSGRPRKCDPKVADLRYNIRTGNYHKAKQTLEEFGIDATDGDARTALISAVNENKLDFIEWCLQNGANINHQDRSGYSALHFIAQDKQVDLVNYFLKNGANPNLKDNHGNTPCMVAVHGSRFEKRILQALIKYGANPDIANNYGVTPRNLFKTINHVDLAE